MVDITRSNNGCRRIDGRLLVLGIMVTVAFVLLVHIGGISLSVEASDEYQRFVQEVLSENELNYNIDEGEQSRLQYSNPNEREETIRPTKIVDNNEKTRKKREETFANELAQLKEDKAAARKLLQQQKRDARIVHRIIHESQSNNHYAVLGLQKLILFEIKIPKCTITVIPNHFTLNIPAIEVFGISEKKIRKAYREMAKLVHPDKSKEPRAVEAFLMVENSAAVLLNATTRAEYDTLLEYEKHRHCAKLYVDMKYQMESTLRLIRTILCSGKNILGPLTIPVVLLVALIA
jgi:DnaJ domain